MYSSNQGQTKINAWCGVRRRWGHRRGEKSERQGGRKMGKQNSE